MCKVDVRDPSRGPAPVSTVVSTVVEGDAEVSTATPAGVGAASGTVAVGMMRGAAQSASSSRPASGTIVPSPLTGRSGVDVLSVSTGDIGGGTELTDNPAHGRRSDGHRGISVGFDGDGTGIVMAPLSQPHSYYRAMPDGDGDSARRPLSGASPVRSRRELSATHVSIITESPLQGYAAPATVTGTGGDAATTAPALTLHTPSTSTRRGSL
jgi:hypothetical protein